MIITEHISHIPDLNALSQVNRRLNTIVSPFLYRRAMRLLRQGMMWYTADTLFLQIDTHHRVEDILEKDDVYALKHLLNMPRINCGIVRTELEVDEVE
jgi:hypothetical protein